MQYVLFLALVVGVRVAAAEEAEEVQPAAPGFTLLDRFDADSRVGADVTFEVERGGRLYVRDDVHAHYIDDRYHLGGYAQVQRWDTWYRDNRDGGTGSPELGLLYLAQPSSPLSWVVRAGVTFPTVDHLDEHTGLNAQWSRPTDLFQHVPGGQFRFSVSAITHGRPWFGRVDLGIDRTYVEAPQHSGATGVRGNLGVGYDFERAAITAEVSTMIADDGIISTAALSIRGRIGRVQPYACVGLPLAADYYAWAATLGADVSLGSAVARSYQSASDREPPVLTASRNDSHAAP